MKKANIIRLFILVLILALGAFLVLNPFGPLFLKGIGVTMGFMAALWLLSVAITDSSIVDIFWGSGFVIIAWLYGYFLHEGEMSVRQQVLLGLITIWGLRLTIYLGIRNIGKGEDYRYANWRQEAGQKWWWLSFFRVFALQGFLLWIISAVYVPAFQISGELGIWEYLGIAFWAIGLFFETVGDYQLFQFKKDPSNKGKVLNTGLWRYTRHPNYFGDSMVWWGFFCFVIVNPAYLIYVFCPIIMTFFLLKVSGVAMLERSLKKTKPQYAEYIRKTSSFIPMPPKK